MTSTFLHSLIECECQSTWKEERDAITETLKNGSFKASAEEIPKTLDISPSWVFLRASGKGKG